MIVHSKDTQFDRPFELEVIPPTRWDAAQAIVYRIGEPLDLFSPSEWSAACREALTQRLLPRQQTRRKRWISATLCDDPTVVSHPPHLRPALLTAARLSAWLPGGILLEKIGDLGDDPVHHAVIITWLAEYAGMSGIRGMETVAPQIAQNPMGTFTVGELDPRRGRRGTPARTDRPVQDHVRTLNRTALSAIEARGCRARYAELYHLFDQAVFSRNSSLPGLDIKFADHAVSSQLLDDLTVSAAREAAVRMHADGIHPVRATETLQLAGYLNESGNRGWHRELTERIGGWRL